MPAGAVFAYLKWIRLVFAILRLEWFFAAHSVMNAESSCSGIRLKPVRLRSVGSAVALIQSVHVTFFHWFDTKGEV
jgi:hypothetical protein